MPNGLNGAAAFVVSIAVLGAGLWIADLLLQPIPMPAGGAAVLSWLAYWITPARLKPRACLAGFLVGALAGVVFHVRSHVVEDRVDSASSLALHVLADLAISAFAAVLILAASIATRLFVMQRARPRSPIQPQVD